MALVGLGFGLARGPRLDVGKHALTELEESAPGDWFLGWRDDRLFADRGISDCDGVFECGPDDSRGCGFGHVSLGHLRWHGLRACACACAGVCGVRMGFLCEWAVFK